MTFQSPLSNLSVRQRVTAAAVSALGRIRPGYYDFTFSVAGLILALDFIGLPFGLIALLLFILIACTVGKRIALRQFPEPSQHHRGVRKLAKFLIEGIAAVMLGFVVLIAVVVGLNWAHGPSGEELALESALRDKRRAGAEHISMAEVLGLKGGTVCLVGYADRVGKDISWAQEAFSRPRSLWFARDDYTVVRIAHRSGSGKVRLWEVSVGALPFVSAGHAVRGVPTKDRGGLFPQHCAPLASAALARAPWVTDDRGAYVLIDSAAHNQTAPARASR